MARQWILTGQKGFEISLEYQTGVKIPAVSELGPHEVLVKLHAASLNYREIGIPTPGVSTTFYNIQSTVLMILGLRWTPESWSSPRMRRCWSR